MSRPSRRAMFFRLSLTGASISTTSRWTDDDLVHINVRRIEQAAALSCRQHGNRVIGAERAKVSTLERVDRDVYLRTRLRKFLTRVKSAAYFLADVEHRRFVAFAFANHDAPAHRHRLHHFTHRLDGDLIRVFSVALAHRARRGDCRRLTYAQEIERQLTLSPHVVMHLLSSPDLEVVCPEIRVSAEH